MSYIYYFDIAAAALSIILFAIVSIRRHYPSIQGKLFKVLLCLNFASSLIEVLCTFLWSKQLLLPVWADYTITAIESIVHFSIHFFFLLYIISLIRGNAGTKIEKIVFGTIYSLGCIFIATNPIHHLSVTIDAANNFNSGIGVLIIDLLAVLSIIYPILITIIHHKKLQNYQAVINIVSFFVLIIAIIVEWFFPKVLIEHFVITVSFSMLTIIFDNPEIYFHGKTNVFNETAFYGMYHEKIENKVPLRFLAFAFKDFDLVIKKYGYDRAHVAIDTTLKNCQQKYGRKNVFALGKDVVIIDTKNINVSKEIEHIADSCYKGGLSKNKDLKLYAIFFVVYCPDDVHTYDDLKDAIYLNLFDKDHSTDESNVTYFDQKMFEQKRRNEAITLALHEAVEQDGFDVYYQPIYQNKTRKFVGVEALVRLRTQVDGKHVSPGEFIPLAEDNGLIYQIDEIVFEKVCRFVRNSDLKKYGIKFVDVNLSLLKLLDSSTFERYSELASRYEIDPSLFNLEITETAEADQKYLSIVKENIERFREFGFNFSLDDYGSGYSTVVYMAEMDTKLVKIDASILWNAIKSRKYYTILENCVRLIYCFDKECLVEGTENDEMVDMCRKLGVDYLQGYHFARPLPEEELIEFLEKNKLNKIY